MPSLTPLHESYCTLRNTPLSQADLLEGIAQLVSTPVSSVMRDVIEMLQRDVLLKVLGVSRSKTRKFQKMQKVQRFHRAGYVNLQRYGRYWVAPSLRRLINLFPDLQHKPISPIAQVLLGALNGLLGDYLHAKQNPLAVPMVLYDHYGMVQQGDLAGRVVIFVHGLCMTHLDWNHSTGGIAEKLLAQRDNNHMLYLSYNTGRRISANGRSFAYLLNELVEQNPDIRSIDLIGHSMGGLVCRSALFYGKQNLQQWIHRVENLVCLGSPHHGAALERFGYALQEKIGHLPIIKLLSYIVNIRSNGILDLRYGSVRDDDWEYNQARIGLIDDNRKPAPLPSHINTYLVAGTLEFESKNNRPLQIIGDGLVSVKSALGEHPNPRFRLKLPESNKAIFYGLNHFELQHHPQIAEQICTWFYPSEDQKDPAALHCIHQYVAPVTGKNNYTESAVS
ncbi:PGAP1-like alpha/beta domain-containing protein [Acinetobacter larvae]|uniref:GPI inositol-deacylase PGAP1-like alpha/beta domain-containing protein n=1 Tax=Acinetobacter larvae TaxID=1789224 RepID=A0A1B2M3F1_9GAMM|nr:hypothetical protein [Acinetobacter larvae]AOA59712.1 hypothetical protein BFG52_16065 [Acinetobacter larvae]